MKRNISIHFDPNKTIAENAKDIGVSCDAIKKYMQKHELSKHGYNFNNRLLKLKNVKKELEDKGIKPTIQQLAYNLGWSNKTTQKYLKIVREYEVETGNKILPVFTLNKPQQLIKSVDSNQNTIIENIIKLHIPKGEIDCDLTYSTGVFYKNKISPPKYKFDKYPVSNDIAPLDDIDKLSDNSTGSVMCDPPFIIDNQKRVVGTNKMVDRFYSFKTQKELEEACLFLIKESHRILSQNGILIFKCMLVLHAGKQIDTPYFVKKMCLDFGFELVDEFILVAKNKVLHGRHPIQQHSRKWHSFFLVFKKR